jgi:hypothetical protein
MRQTLKERRKQLRGGIPMPRVLTMVLMLAIMALIFVRLRDPSTWRWFTRDDDDDVQVVLQNGSAGAKRLTQTGQVAAETSPQQSAAPAAAKPSALPSGEKPVDSGKAPAANPQPPVPAAAAGNAATPQGSPKTPPELTATGSTDLDPMEWDDMKSNISLVEDGSFEMNKLEMAAYFQILNWVDHQPTELLRKRAHKDVVYSDFRRSPGSMRLQIVELKLRVVQVLRCFGPPENGIEKPITSPNDKPIYELRGFSQEGGTNLFFGIVTDLPEGMPIGTSVDEYVKLVGYFFKLQGYTSQQQQTEAEQSRKKPITLKAPVIIGRVIWAGAPVVAEQKTPFWLLGTIFSVSVVVVVGWVLLAARRSRRHSLPMMAAGGGLDPDGPCVDNWLDQAQSGRITLEPVPELTDCGDGAALGGASGGRLSGNTFWENGESSNGRSSGGSSGDGHGGSDLGANGQEP